MVNWLSLLMGVGWFVCLEYSKRKKREKATNVCDVNVKMILWNDYLMQSINGTFFEGQRMLVSGIVYTIQLITTASF